MLMKAARLWGQYDMRVEELEVPRAKAGTAVLKVASSGICGSDLHWYSTRPYPQPTVLGHELSGQVVELGRGADCAREADRVCVDLTRHFACGHCRYCSAGQYFACPHKSRAAWGGGFAEYMEVRATALHLLPECLSYEQGAMVEPLAVAVHAFRRCRIRPGDIVLVLGAGTVGLLCMAVAKIFGAGRAYGIAKYDVQARMAEKMGADGVIRLGEEELGRRVRELAGGQPIDIVLETVGGSAPSVDQALYLVRPQGKVAVLGVFPDPMLVNLEQAMEGEVTLVFSTCYSAEDGRHDYEIASDLIATGKLDPTELITHRFPLEQTPEAFGTALDKKTGSVKVMVNVGIV